MKSPNGRIPLLFLLALIVLPGASGCGKPSQKPAAAEGKRFSGKVHTVSRAPVAEYYLASGQARSRYTSVLSSRISGYVRRVNAQEGQRVAKGQILAEIESAELNAQNRKAIAGAAEAQQARLETEHALQAAASAVKAGEAQSRLAAETYRRYQALLAKDSVSRQEFEEVEARHLAAQAQLEQASQFLDALNSRQSQIDAKVQQAQAEVAGSQTYLSYLRITAPFSGVVTKRYVDQGALAAPGSPLLTVENDTILQLEISVPESLRWKMADSSPISADLETADLRDLIVKPLEVPAAADSATRSFLFKLELPSSPKLRPGMFGRARIPIGQREALQIPAGCLVRQGQLEGIFIVSDTGLVQWRLVKSGATAGDKTEILSGLKTDEKVVENPPADLSDGDRFEVRS